MKNKIDLNKIEELLSSSKTIKSSEFKIDNNFKESLRHELYKNYILSKSNFGFVNSIKNIFSNTKYNLMTGLALTIISILVIGLIGILNNNPNQIKILKANLTASTGIVEIKKINSSDWSIANLGETIYQGDSIRTAENSRAIINIDNGDALRLNSSTEVNLESTLSNRVVIAQTTGETYSRVMKSDDNHYRLKSNGIESLALGTAYTFKLGTDNTAIINTFESKVRVSYQDKSNEVTALNKLTINFNKVKTELSEVTETEYKNEFVQWNKKQDEDLGFKYAESVAPILTVNNPSQNFTTGESSVLISGKATDNSSLKKITVNDIIYSSLDENGNGFNISTGEYKILNKLVDGQNIIRIKAYDMYWNSSDEQKIIVNKLPTPTKVIPTPTKTKPITFSITNISSPGTGKIYLKWLLNNISAPKGFKIILSTSSNPVYPGNDSQYLTNPNTRDYTWTGLPAGTYHLRVCIYDGKGHCIRYSNDKTVTVSAAIPTPTPSPAAQISSLTATYGSCSKKVTLNWTVTGTWDKQFKVVWSESANPVYPGNSHYISDSATRTDYVYVSGDGLLEGHTYHFRVCLYNSSTGSCTSYSPDKSITIPAPTTVPTSTSIATSTP